MSPTQMTADSSLSASPASSRTIHLSSTSVIHSPLPRTPIRAETLQSAAESERSSPQFLTPTSHAPVIRIESPDRSNSTTSSFTPAVIGPGSPRYSSPRAESEVSDAARSTTYDVVAPPGSRVISPSGTSQRYRYSPMTSPFSEVHHPLSPHGLRSPSPVILSPVTQSSLHLRSEGDTETAVLSPSLRSGMFSPGFNFEDDPFEITSDLDDNMSDWESLDRRTPSP